MELYFFETYFIYGQILQVDSFLFLKFIFSDDAVITKM